MGRLAIPRSMLVLCLVLQTLLGACLGCPCSLLADSGSCSSLSSLSGTLPVQAEKPRSTCCETRAVVKQSSSSLRILLPTPPHTSVAPTPATLAGIAGYPFYAIAQNRLAGPDLIELQILRQ